MCDALNAIALVFMAHDLLQGTARYRSVMMDKVLGSEMMQEPIGHRSQQLAIKMEKAQSVQVLLDLSDNKLTAEKTESLAGFVSIERNDIEPKLIGTTRRHAIVINWCWACDRCKIACYM